MEEVVVTKYWMAMVTGMMALYAVIALIGLATSRRKKSRKR